MRALHGLARAIDRLNEAIGVSVAWLALLTVLVEFTVVLMRYVFGIGSVKMQESIVYMHAMVFMIAAGYTLLHNGHVRIDIVYRPASARYKAWVDLLGSIFLLMPIVIMVFWLAWPYVAESWATREGSRESGGLPGLYLLKTVILAFCVLILAQGLSLARRSVLVLAGHPEFTPQEDETEKL